MLILDGRLRTDWALLDHIAALDEAGADPTAPARTSRVRRFRRWFIWARREVREAALLLAALLAIVAVVAVAVGETALDLMSTVLLAVAWALVVYGAGVWVVRITRTRAGRAFLRAVGLKRRRRRRRR